MRIGFISGSTDVGCFYILGGDNKLHKVDVGSDGMFSFSITLCPVDHQASFSISETSNKAQALARLVTDSFGRELPNGIIEESSDPIAFWFEKAKKFLRERKEEK